MPQVLFSHVSKSYTAQARPDTLLDINFHVNQGESLAIVGPSGCGKTTLLRMLAGIESVTKGEISIAGKVVNNLAPAKRGLEMVFQSQSLYPHMTVQQNLSFGLLNKRLKRAEIQHRVKWAAKLLDIERFLTLYPHELAKGERQRVAIARALAPQTPLVLFDEPFEHLSGEIRSHLRLELIRIQRQLGTTMIMVTHDHEDAMGFADRMALLSQLDASSHTNLEQIGPPLELYHHPRNIKVASFVGKPKMSFFQAKLTDKANPTSTIALSNGETLSVSADTRHGEEGEYVTLGLRAEHIELASSAAAGQIHGQVIGIERFGSDTFVYLEYQGEQIAFRCDPHQNLPSSSQLALKVSPQVCYLFNHQGVAYPRTVEHLYT
ncbi:ABC transporter ATP-binding protein [Motilimonas pumila]|uniref:ABC transporter ATP-binding protein n=1 Tax=Motilimonas pumila TaxID=2303987 RepID=A0A418YBT7_9GAMM|nr:ABC transporter ATP-binding protein [Motilimonas pumila]RJG41981.1 ABC transporter ATP-binding protein [Motilimonas pumila]